MTIKRCSACHGKKKIAPLGFIEKDCNACNAIGFVTVIPPKAKINTAFKDANDVEVSIIKKKRGRPNVDHNT